MSHINLLDVIENFKLLEKQELQELSVVEECGINTQRSDGDPEEQRKYTRAGLGGCWPRPEKAADLQSLYSECRGQGGRWSKDPSLPPSFPAGMNSLQLLHLSSLAPADASRGWNGRGQGGEGKTGRRWGGGEGGPSAYGKVQRGHGCEGGWGWEGEGEGWGMYGLPFVRPG